MLAGTLIPLCQASVPDLLLVLLLVLVEHRDHHRDRHADDHHHQHADHRPAIPVPPTTMIIMPGRAERDRFSAVIARTVATPDLTISP
jgi:hypothetical protein